MPNTACTDVDYKAIIYGVQLATHFMRKNRTPGGQIIATASVAGVHPHPTYPEYCGAKAAVTMSSIISISHTAHNFQVISFALCVEPVLRLVSRARWNNQA
jgi:NAD(P)-dependent dehydrogenase (short-subunit alcohol dehydrogenase family)